MKISYLGITKLFSVFLYQQDGRVGCLIEHGLNTRTLLTLRRVHIPLDLLLLFLQKQQLIVILVGRCCLAGAASLRPHNLVVAYYHRIQLTQSIILYVVSLGEDAARAIR